MLVIFIFSVLFLAVLKKAFHLSPDPLRYGLSGHFRPQQALGGSPAYGCNHFSKLGLAGSLCADRGHSPPDIILRVLWHRALLARFPPDGRPSQPPSQLFSAQFPWGTFVLGLFSFPLGWTIAPGDPIRAKCETPFFCRTPQVFTSSWGWGPVVTVLAFHDWGSQSDPQHWGEKSKLSCLAHISSCS